MILELIESVVGLLHVGKVDGNRVDPHLVYG